MEKNPVGWFEIPVTDMARDRALYEQLPVTDLFPFPLGALEMSVFNSKGEEHGAYGALVYHLGHYKPSADGVLVYFTAHSGDLANELTRVETAGGKVIQPKTHIADDLGHMAIYIDTEGNRIVLHSMK